MEVEKLISAVFAHECLWNQAHPDHHNRFVLEKEWEEVSTSLNSKKTIGVVKYNIFLFTEDIIKSKWKYCRDTFRKEFAKRPKPRSGSEAGTEIESKWVYFKSLLFLKDQFTTRNSTSNLQVVASCVNRFSDESTDISVEITEQEQDKTEESEYTESVLNNYTENFTEKDVLLSVPQSPLSSHNEEPRVVIQNRKRKRSEDLVGKALVNIEREKLKILESKQRKVMDEDRCFFESLLPHVKKMNPLKKLLFRTEVQQLVMTYSYNYSENKSASVSDNYSDSSQFSPTNLTTQNTSDFPEIW
ncbi:uncharacterized protein [Rhodnius prolixus]|uniref:uncharacterized protein n=1 Tax=Rhodnius prolixus TaxID=13249 RepID=UPI003D18FC39